MSDARRPVCLACGSDALSAFYEQLRVPVHSCLLVDDREEALRFPTGDIELAFCDDCGFIMNVAFDRSVHDYSSRYEETQQFSPRFQNFARDLARRWIDRYHLQGRHCFEIGCGKGSFLEELCAHGADRGTGIDPSFRADRVEAKSNMTFVADFYDERYGPIDADAVICRHTLEHIPDVADFMRTVRTGIGDALDTAVLWEVPDVTRVLADTAFWDVYYEHCSYFGPGSLAALFARTGFDIVECFTDFDDQYLVLEARPARAPSTALPRRQWVADHQHLRELTRGFAAAVDARMRTWRSDLDEACRRGERVVIWGAGSKGVSYLTALRLGGEIECAVDVNPHKAGKFMAGTGHAIVGPEALVDREPDVVVVMNPIYRDEIARSLDELGLHPKLVTV
jgi:SAM-dependent methyltransferase